MNLTLRNPAFIGSLRVPVVTLVGTIPAYDTFETYPLGTDLNGLAEGVGGGYI